MSTPNPTPLTYNSWFTQVGALAVETVAVQNGVATCTSDALFNTAMTQALNYAELRIQRDLDLLALEVLDTTSYQTTAGNNQLTIDPNEFYIAETITVNGAPLLQVTRAFLQNVCGAGSTQGPPRYFAPGGGDAATGGVQQLNYLLGPIPDQAYPVAISGRIRAPSLASFATNGPAASSRTWISTYLPDLLIAASMVYISGYQRNFGAQSDDSGNAVSWEGTYKTLLAGATVEEARRNLRAAAWSDAPPAQVAAPNRGA